MSQIFNRDLRQQDSALFYARNELAVIQKKGYPKWLEWHRGRAYGDLDKAHIALGNTDSALYYGNLAIEVYKKANKKNYEINAASRVIHNLYMVGRVKDAHQLILEYDRMAEELTDTLSVADYYNTTGALLSSLSDSSAITRLNKAYQLLDKIRHPYALSTLINLGGWYQVNANDFDKAYGVYQLYLSKLPKDSLPGIANYYITMGILFRDRKRGNTDSSLVYLSKGLELASSLNMKPTARLAAWQLAAVYHGLGKEKEALRYCTQSLEMSEAAGDVFRVYRCLAIMDDIYLALNEPSRAYEVLNRYKLLDDSLNVEKQKSQVRNLELQHKVEQMDLERQLRERDIRILKQRRLGAGLGIVFLSLLGAVMAIHLERTNRQRKQLFLRVRQLAASAGDLAGMATPVPETPADLSTLPQEEGKANEPGRPQVSDLTALHLSHLLRSWIRGKGYLERVTILELATRLKTNSRYLSEVISREYRVSHFSDFINKLRINHLLQLLESEPVYRNYTVESLAGHLGFGSKTTFIKAFREMTGLTPYFYLDHLRRAEPIPAALAG